MENLVSDIFIEFLEVAFHLILYTSNIYPKEIFDDRKKYGAPVKYSLHPVLNKYITDCLKSAKILIESESLEKAIFCILDSNCTEIFRFVFSVNFITNIPKDTDHYLIKCEQNFRTFCLKFLNSDISLRDSKGSSFNILLCTNESEAVKLSKNPEVEYFPFIEYSPNKDIEDNEYFITPIHTISVDSASLQVYVEHL